METIVGYRHLKGDERPDEQIREHYLIEVALADRLRQSVKAERLSGKLYTVLYDELYRRVPHHQQLTRKVSVEGTAKGLQWQYGMVGRFLRKDAFFLEVGPGDCALSFKVAPSVAKVFAVDISSIVTHHSSAPGNFKLILSDGCDIPLPGNSIDIAYSNQLMEHLHPDDAREQMQNIYNVLKPGGRYICITPNKINGPWDISYCCDETARGFHLKEYSMGDLMQLFNSVGFRKLSAYAGARGYYVRFPISLVVWLEQWLSKFPFRIRAGIGRSLMFRAILGIRLVGVK